MSVDKSNHELDTYWQKLLDFLTSSISGRIVVPDPLDRVVDDAVRPDELKHESPEDFGAIVVHKDLYTRFPPDFLHLAIHGGHIVFANEVFIVLAPSLLQNGQVPDESHVSALPLISSWARNGASPEAIAATPEFSPFALARSDLLERMAGLISSELVKPLSTRSGKANAIAVAETAKPFEGSEWFWVDDAAKVAELFCLPAIDRLHPGMAERLVETVVACSRNGFVYRRIGAPYVNIVKPAVDAFQVASSFYVFTGDLSSGIVNQGIRFNDGRTRTLVSHMPGELRFAWQGETVSTDLCKTIFHGSIAQDGDSIVLCHYSTVRRPGNVMRELAIVRCAYVISAGRNALRLKVEVKPAAMITLDDLQISTRMTNLPAFAEFSSLAGDGWASAPLPDAVHGSGGEDEAAEHKLAAEAQFVSLYQTAGQPEHAAGIHVGSPATPFDARMLQREEAGYSATLVHGISDAARRKAGYSIEEDRLLTSGGYYDDPEEYRALGAMEPGRDFLRDPSMSYDIGAELNAIATYLFFAKHPAHVGRAGDNGKTQDYRDWYDRHLARYMKRVVSGDGLADVFVRGLAFVIVSLDTMQRTFPDADYGPRLERLGERLLATQLPVRGWDRASIFASSRSYEAHPELDSHCAAILALSRLAFTPCDRKAISKAIARGLRAIRNGVPDTAVFGNRPLNHETLILAADPDSEFFDSGYWTYKLGLALRAFHGVSAAQSERRIELSDVDMRHLERLSKVAKSALAQAAVWRDTTIEILTSVDAGETNSETQPWVAAGLVPAVDREILGLEMTDWYAERATS